MITLKLHHHADGTYERVRVFAGPDLDRLALCGELVMLPDEWAALGWILRFGDAGGFAEVVIAPDDAIAALDRLEADLDRVEAAVDRVGGNST